MAFATHMHVRAVCESCRNGVQASAMPAARPVTSDGIQRLHRDRELLAPFS